jgi:hypothetical protein
MIDLRTRRSTDRDEAIKHLLDAVSMAHGGRGIALVDERGRMLAGSGAPHEMWVAVRSARRGSEGVGEGFRSATVEGAEEPLHLAAFGLGRGERGLDRAALGVARILRSP